MAGAGSSAGVVTRVGGGQVGDGQGGREYAGLADLGGRGERSVWGVGGKEEERRGGREEEWVGTERVWCVVVVVVKKKSVTKAVEIAISYNDFFIRIYINTYLDIINLLGAQFHTC